MASNLNVSEISREKMNNSNNSVSKLNSKMNKKINKTPEMLYINNSRKLGNSLKTQRRKISTISFESNSYFQPLTFSREENNYDQSEILHKKYLVSITKIEQINSDISNINKKLDDNIIKIEKLTEGLKKLKEDKKQKQIDIVNLLSNKESLEEIYKNKVYYLIKNKELTIQKKEKKNKNNNIEDNEIKTHVVTDSENFRMEEENELEIKIEEIKKSEKKKFVEQVISFSDDIFQKSEEVFHSNIKDKINIAYIVFSSEVSSSSSTIKADTVVSNFFSRIGLFISNHSLGNFSETLINKFLRYLLKINYIGIEIFQIIKFLNKKYKEQKKEYKDQISNLTKRNENLNEKRKILEKRREELEIKLEKKKQYIQNYEQNREKSEIKFLNNTLEGLYSLRDFSNLHLNGLNEKNKEINNSQNDNINSTEEIKDNNNTKEVIYIYNQQKKKQNNINDKNDEQNYMNIKDNESKDNIINNNNDNNNNATNTNNEIENVIMTSNEKTDTNINENININTEIKKNTIDIEKKNKTSLNKKIKMGLEKIKDKKLKITKLFKTKNNKNNKLTNVCKSSETKNEKLTLNKLSSKSNNNKSQNNNDINNNINFINKNNKKIANSVVINNNININEDAEMKNENNQDEKEINVLNSQEIFNDKQNKTDLKLNDNKVFYSKKKIDNMKIKKNNTSGKIVKKIILSNNNTNSKKEDSINNKNNILNDDNNISEVNNKNILYNNNSFNTNKKQYNNKNIYIINNINNSEQIVSKNNIYNNNQYKKINSKSQIQKEANNEDNIYTYNKFDKINTDKKNNGNMISKIKKNDKHFNTYSTEEKEGKNNLTYNFHDILNTKKRGNSINNKILNSINLENVKFFPIKKKDSQKNKNLPNSPPIYLHLNTKNKSIFHKSNIVNNTDDSNASKQKKKLIDTYVIKEYKQNTVNSKMGTNQNKNIRQKINNKEYLIYNNQNRDNSSNSYLNGNYSDNVNVNIPNLNTEEKMSKTINKISHTFSP